MICNCPTCAHSPHVFLHLFQAFGEAKFYWHRHISAWYLLLWGGKRWKSGILTVFLDKLVNPLGVSKQARIAASVIFFVVGFVSLLIGAVLAWSVSDPMAHLRCLPTTFFHGGSGTRLENCGYQDNANA